MSINVTETQIISFQNNMELVLQPTDSLLWPYAMQQPGRGKLVELTNLFGVVNAQEGDVRHGDTQYVNTPHSRRWCPKDKPVYLADLVDTEDQLKAGIDIQGGYVMTFAAGLARKKDERFLKGFYGTARTGETGATSVNFPAGRIIAATTGAAAATGMNIEKVIEANAMMKRGQVDMRKDECYMALTSIQYGQLLRDVRATSKDFISAGDRSVLETGTLPKLLGFNFIEMEYGDATFYPDAAPLTLDGSSHRRVPVWCKRGMAALTWGAAVSSSIDRLPQKRNSVQVYAECDVAAARTQENFCLQIMCAE